MKYFQNIKIKHNQIVHSLYSLYKNKFSFDHEFINKKNCLFYKSIHLPGLPYYLSKFQSLKYTSEISENIYNDSLARNFIIFNNIKPIINKFKDNLIFIKGFPLSNSEYPDPGIRSYYDIDIFIDNKTKKIKNELYDFLKKSGWNLILKNKFQKNNIVIDIHTCIINSDRNVYRKYLIKNLKLKNKSVTIENTTFYTLQTDCHIFFLLLHFLKHNFIHYATLADLTVLFKNHANELKNDLFFESLNKNKISTLMFYLCKNYLFFSNFGRYILKNKNRLHINKSELFFLNILYNYFNLKYSYKLFFLFKIPNIKSKFFYLINIIHPNNKSNTND